MVTLKNLEDRKKYLQDSVNDLIENWFYSVRGLAKELWTYPKKIKEIRDGKVTKITEINWFIKKLWLK